MRPLPERIVVAIAVVLLVASLGYSREQTNQKVIKDPAEYNAYMNALNTQSPAARGAAMEAFVKQYPNSVVKIDALEQAMAAYQQTGDSAKVYSLATQILALEPGNVRALAILAFIDRSAATAGGPKAATALEESCNYAKKGLEAMPGWQKPDGLSDADFQKLRNQIADIFNGAAGFCALQKKDYAGARGYLAKAFQLDPTNLQDTYQLAVACLEMTPIDVEGFWYLAKSLQLATNNAQALNGMSAYGKAKYRRYHGGDDGWDQLTAAAATQSQPPADFARSIKPAPTPADLAVQAVQQNDPATLSFSDKEFILSYRDASAANQQAADKVWAALWDLEKQGEAKLKIHVKVLSSTAKEIEAAITDENQASNQADLHVTMEKAMPNPPAAGTMIDVIGLLTRYTPRPFKFFMEHGELPAQRP